MSLKNCLKTCVLLVFFLLPILHFSLIPYFSSNAQYIFELNLASSSEGLIQIFYDLGEGLSEDLSVTRPLKATKKFRNYKFAIPPGKYKQIRLDPNNGTGEFKINAARIVDRRGATLRTWKGTDFIAAHQIQIKETQGDSVTFATTKAAYDPMLLLGNSNFLLKAGSGIMGSDVLNAALYWSLCVIICIFSLCITNWVKANWRIFFQIGQTRSSAKVLFVTALMTTLVSLYPVVFFNRSFVSPLNGPVALLYPNKPWVPDFHGNVAENVRASDVGAMAWEFLPYSRAQHKAIFKDRQLPLWYSANSAGVPLLGQGLSMLGDPLHWIVVALDGTAGAWDLKYILSRFSFVFAIAIGVFLATQSIGAALVVSTSAAFVGFFSYRFNHSANFGFCHAAWILSSWIGIISAKSSRTRSAWVGVLALASLMVINSGTVKEAYILAVMLNMTGGICMLFSLRNILPKTLAIMLFSGICFVLVSAPFWLTFIFTLKESVTLSDGLNPPQLLDLARLAGLFDEIFFVRLQNSLLFAGVFSANSLIMGLLVWGLLNINRLKHDKLYLGLLVSALIPFALVFLSTPEIIYAIPFIRHVVHITDTFLCVLLIQIFILAGFGVRCFMDTLGSAYWKRSYLLFLLIITLILGYHFLASHAQATKFSPAIPSSDFQFYIIIVPLIASMAILPWLFSFLFEGSKNNARYGCVVAMILYALLNIHGRYGMHLETGNEWLDYLRANPGKRADFSAKSNAVEALKNRSSEPFRVVGSGPVLFPGFQGYYGLDAIIGPDPLMSPYYRELMPALGFEYQGGWTIHVDIQNQESFQRLSPGLDLLNVHYVLAYPGALDPRNGLNLIGSYDLNLYERTNAWPRAYFTSNVLAYNGPKEFAELVKQNNNQPLAALQTGDNSIDSKLFGLTNTDKSPTFVPANDYNFLTNTFSFSIESSEKGIVVLTNAYYRDAFEVSINGQGSSYFRVNHAFMGVLIPEKGHYQITFRYNPWYWKLALLLSVIGLAGILWIVLAPKSNC